MILFTGIWRQKLTDMPANVPSIFWSPANTTANPHRNPWVHGPRFVRRYSVKGQFGLWGVAPATPTVRMSALHVSSQITVTLLSSELQSNSARGFKVQWRTSAQRNLTVLVTRFILWRGPFTYRGPSRVTRVISWCASHLTVAPAQ
jgi:hypothetical protein